MYTPTVEKKVDDRLLATHISNNSNFEAACLSGNGTLIKSIIETEMMEHDLFTKGSKKLQADILRMLQGKEKVSTITGSNILAFVWNSRLSGINLAVAK